MPSLAEHSAWESFGAVHGLAAPDAAQDDCEAAKKRAEPYDKIVGELPEMRAQAVELVSSRSGTEDPGLCPGQ